MDDLASTLIARIWLEQKEFENERHLRFYVRKAVQKNLGYAVLRSYRLARFSELIGDGIENEMEYLDTLFEPIAPHQENAFEARRLLGLARTLPALNASLVLILAEGASIVEVAKDLGMNGWDALALLEQTRRMLNDEPVEQPRLAA